MDDAQEIGGHGSISHQGPSSRPGIPMPDLPLRHPIRPNEVPLAREFPTSEAFGSIDSRQALAMRVYEAKIEYHVVSHGQHPVLDRAPQVYRYMADVLDKFPMNETFWVIMLNRKTRAIARHLCTTGTLTSSLVHPREVFKPAILSSAAGIIVAHNHPSGDPAPSSADLQVTRQLREAARTLDISLIDHVVLGRPEADPTGRGYYSFREAGLL